MDDLLRFHKRERGVFEVGALACAAKLFVRPTRTTPLIADENNPFRRQPRLAGRKRAWENNGRGKRRPPRNTLRALALIQINPRAREVIEVAPQSKT